MVQYALQNNAKSGFYQIPLDEASWDLTVIITPIRRYRHKRLPMGISVAPEISQCKMSMTVTYAKSLKL